MEKKLLITTLVGIIITIIIFNITSIDKINYTSIGDSISYGITTGNIHCESYSDYIYDILKYELEDYNNSYAINNLTVRNLYDLLIFNETYENDDKTIQQIINESDIITIAIGYDELNNGYNVELYLYYFELILKKISTLTNADIYIISVPIFNDEVDYVNNNIKILSENLNYSFISIDNIVDNMYIFNDSMYISQNTHKLIANEIISSYK